MKTLIKLITLLLACVLLTGCAGTAPTVPAQREYTDSLGRTVSLPATIDRIAVTGTLAQYVIFALCPDKLVGVASAWDPSADGLLPEYSLELPVLGQLYGGRGTLNAETLLASGAQLVIDIGEPKDTAAADLDALQRRLGIPFVHVTARLASMGDTYRTLGELLDLPEKAEALAAYCEDVYSDTAALADTVEKVKALYVTGSDGLSVIAAGSYHSEVFDMLTENLAVIENPAAGGTGNTVDPEQLLFWDPDYVVFSPSSSYDSVGTDEAWSQITAIAEGNYCEVPLGPCNWMGFPPSVQQFLGMRWLAKQLYPEACGYDLYEETNRCLRLFFHCELSESEYRALTAHSLHD